MKDIIKPNMLFRDGAGCLLKTLRRAPGTNDWWCTGQPDCIGQWRYSTKTILAGVLPTTKGMGERDEEIKKVEAERDVFIQFIQYLKEDHPAFADAFDQTGDLIGTHEGFFGYWDDVIEACGGGSYGHSPLELIGVIRIALEESEAELDEALEEVERLRSELRCLCDCENNRPEDEPCQACQALKPPQYNRRK